MSGVPPGTGIEPARPRGARDRLRHRITSDRRLVWLLGAVDAWRELTFVLGQLLGPFWVKLWRHRHAVRALRAPPPRSRDAAPRVLMLVISDVRRDPRVERASRALAGAGYEVLVMFPNLPGEPAEGPALDWGPGVEFRAVPGHAASYIYRFPFVLGSSLLDAACRERPFAIHCHDLTTTVVGLCAAGRVGAYCVCDYHEWYSENASIDIRSGELVAHGPVRRWIYRLAEALASRRADGLVTVCRSIADGLNAAALNRRRDIAVVRNIPPLPEGPPVGDGRLREELGVGAETFVLLWQGGLGPTRLLEPVIEAVAGVAGVVLVLRGPGAKRYGPGYRGLARSLGAEDRLRVLDPVPSAQVVPRAVGADAGIWTLPRPCLNFYYALPNKIFEYMAAGVPVLGADYPEARGVIEGLQVGICFDPYDPGSIASAIARMKDDGALRQRCRDNIAPALASLRADEEWNKLVSLYDDLR